MAFTSESEFIFLGKGDESFLENYSYELRDDPEGSAGKIFMALEILNNQAEAEDIGEAIFENFKQKFYEEREAQAYQRFEEALKVANQVIETLKEEKVSKFIGNLNIAVGTIVGDMLFISTTGDAEVYLVRKRFTSIVSEGLAEDSSKETFINIANGALEPCDSVLFSSSRLLRYITKGELGKIFSNVGPGRIGQALADLQDFIMAEILGRSALIGIYMNQDDEETETLGESWEPSHKGKLAEVINRFSRIFEKIPGFSKLTEKASSLIASKISSRSSGSRTPAIRFPHRMTKERILLSVLVLLVILIGGVFWLRTRGTQKRAIALQQTKLNHVQEILNDVSTVGQFDKQKAAELLQAAERETYEVLNSHFLRGEAVKMLDSVEKQRDSLDDIKRITEPTILADFGAKRTTVNALGLLSLKDRLYGFEYNALYEMILDKLQDPLTIHDVETVILAADFPEYNSLLFLTRTNKMIEYKDTRFSFAVTKDGIWKRGVDMKTYNDRLYLLDPERNQIWRYIRRRDNFDIGEGYNQNAQLQNGVSLAIDSSVYVLQADGYITQLYQGQKQNFPIRKAPIAPITEATKIYTNTDLGSIFILEPSKKRVLVFKKDPKNGGAQYQTQYVFEKVGQLRDLLVADNRLYVMDDKKVYYINLSGL